jgi:hypothetical protein
MMESQGKQQLMRIFVFPKTKHPSPGGVAASAAKPGKTQTDKPQTIDFIS